jgi:hypothetical protein
MTRYDSTSVNYTGGSFQSEPRWAVLGDIEEDVSDNDAGDIENGLEREETWTAILRRTEGRDYDTGSIEIDCDLLGVKIEKDAHFGEPSYIVWVDRDYIIGWLGLKWIRRVEEHVSERETEDARYDT